MEKGPHKPSADNLERIVLRCPNLNLTWLLTGKGQMLLDAQPVSFVSRPANTLPDEMSKDLVAQAENVLLREQIADLRSTVAFLKEELGKFGSSPDAAGDWLGPLAPRGYQLARANR